MTHEELLQKLTPARYIIKDEVVAQLNALRAVVELHKPMPCESDGIFNEHHYTCSCGATSPCPTYEAIEKELK